MSAPLSCLAGLRRGACLLAVALPCTLWAQPRFDLRSTQTRLPTTVLPSQVQLVLDVDPARDTFSGEVTIRLRARQAVPAIVLHAQGLQSDSAQLRHGSTTRRLSVQPDEATATWRLTPQDGRPIAAGVYRLHLRYRGEVQRSGEGLFRADFRIQGQPARVLATQLQAVQARRVLPVFDEPVFRAVFDIAVRAPTGYEVLSNMPLRHARPEGVTVLHRFAPTPAMPSYLLAVAVGRYDVLEGQAGGLPLRIFTAPGKREQAHFAMQATQQLLPFYASYFGRPFMLPKLDQVAVPAGRQGAMEDWGLISYSESALLFDPARSSPRAQRRVFSIVAHEIAHQWFGNLVSVASWNEIWLNEAFATWMANKASAHFHPEWQTALHERQQLQRTLARDATSATRAIRSGPVSEDSVFEVFDNITYDKGGAVLTMLEQWIGPQAFQRGLAAYMAERAYKPATAGDLWFHMARSTGLPVAEVAASWTNQPGLPLIRVSTVCQAGTTVLSLQQSRLALGEPLAGGPWLVPLRVARGNEERTVMLSAPSGRFELPGCTEEPLRANAGGLGFYVVAYDAAQRARLAAAFGTFPPADRVALLSDSFALASGGLQPMADHLTLLAALPQVQGSSREALISLALAHWRALDTALHGSAVQAPLRAAGRALFGPELARLGWQSAAGEDSETSNLRAALIRELANLDDEDVMAQARRHLAAALAPAGGGLAPSIRGAVIAAVGVQATAPEFDALLAAFEATESQEERWVLLSGLAAGRDSQRAMRLLEQAINPQLPPDISTAIPGMVGANPAHGSLSYDFVVKHWDTLQRAAGVGPFGGRNWLLPGAAASAHEPAVAARLLQDQQRLAGSAGASTAANIAQVIEQRHRLREREAGPLASVLISWR
jgi:aminopeptidase N